MVWLIGLLPTAVFLVFMPVLETVIAQKDRYRTQSVYGFRSTRAVKNPENWRNAQLAVRDSSFVLAVFNSCLRYLYVHGQRIYF